MSIFFNVLVYQAETQCYFLAKSVDLSLSSSVYGDTACWALASVAVLPALWPAPRCCACLLDGSTYSAGPSAQQSQQPGTLSAASSWRRPATLPGSSLLQPVQPFLSLSILSHTDLALRAPWAASPALNGPETTWKLCC